MRIGFGYDIHRFSKNRKLILGGVLIDYHSGLKGHSDADVLLHAICDAMLGAAGLSDIGFYFPNTDNKYKNISSIILLQECKKLITENKFTIINIDSTIILEEPKINKYIGQMKDNISKALRIKKSQLGIKATTAETLGSLGSKKGCSAYAVCSLK